ncbi:hypothetical protein L1987_14451 [Smallanthus sonchifolius]|uniref:Uncharacterized protein n=1 Tax=Smallanthus sonchifolius TaxID=185202 RepID=A0ACB9J3V5_9ASTR|nr:hypothetical protein L1987_14451 [Smallanthus sonchifolius]
MGSWCTRTPPTDWFSYCKKGFDDFNVIVRFDNHTHKNYRLDLDELLCEPLSDVCWLLPLDSPIIDEINSLNQKSLKCFVNILKISNNSSSSSSLPYVHLHLVHDYDDNEQLFFHDQDQSFLQKGLRGYSFSVRIPKTLGLTFVVRHSFLRLLPSLLSIRYSV